MKTSLKQTLSMIGTLTLVGATSGHSAEIIPIDSFDPNTFFSGGITAGLDFDDGTSSNYPDPTQPGFLSIPASNNKSYNVTTGGITFDIQVANANFGNQNRNRNNVNAGTLMTDFEQWYGGQATEGNAVEATFTLTGLAANTDYQISFFTANVGAGQTTHSFYEGTSSAAPLITTFTTSGNQNTYSTWKPGITFQINSGPSAEIAVTVQANQFFNSGANRYDSRLTMDGVAVTAVGGPPPTPFGINSIALDPDTDEVTMTFVGGEPNTTYFCLSSTDLINFSTIETPINGTDLTSDGTGAGSFMVAASGGTRFYRLSTTAPDVTAPTPDPMTWASVPAATSSSAVTMTATEATDPSGVEYYFTETSGNPGGDDSGWQDDPSYTDTGLDASTEYTYTVKARDKSANQNETAASTPAAATTNDVSSITIIPIDSFDPATFFSGGITAGIDFDDGTSSNYPDPTQPGFLSIPASNNKSYNVTTGGITFDIQVANANFGNQNRNRNNVNAGTLMTDFEQWYGGQATEGNAVEATFTLTGLAANTDYQISFFTANVGAGQTTHSFYEGTSSAAPLITTFTTSGNQNTYSTWKPGITFQINSGPSAEIAVTVQANQFFNSGANRYDSRLTMDGISVNAVTPPPPAIYSEDFEDDNGGFTVSTTQGSDWEHGTPDSSSPGGTVTEGNGASTNCWGTKLGDFNATGDPGQYADPTTTVLRSSIIDLTGLAAAELTFAEAMDLEVGDTAVLNIIDDTTDAVIAAAVYIATDGNGGSADWAPANGGTAITIPAAALGQPVRLEWSLTGFGGATDDYLGWYIDDVVVSGN